jgi:hypothetical protein
MLPLEIREPPPGAVDPIIAERVADVLDRQQATGLSVMAAMRNNRRWNNPAFLKKMVDYYHLQPYGTALGTEVWDPEGIPEEDKWTALHAQIQARKRPRGGEVRFTSAGQQQLGQAAAAAAAAAAAGVTLAGQAGVTAAAAAAGGAVAGLAAAAGASKVLPGDLRKLEQAQAQAQALANALMSGAAAAGAKKSKWDQ